MDSRSIPQVVIDFVGALVTNDVGTLKEKKVSAVGSSLQYCTWWTMVFLGFCAVESYVPACVKSAKILDMCAL